MRRSGIWSRGRRSMTDSWPRDLPAPPVGLEIESLPIVEAPPLWFRCHRSVRDAIHFGRGIVGRFNDQGGAYGVLYVGLDPRAAFIEVFGDSGTISERALHQRVLSSLVAHRSPRVVDLTGGHLARMSLDARISTGDHRTSQAWARAFHDHPDQPDGVLYRCRHDPSQFALAVFDTAGLTIEATQLGTSTLAALAASYGLAVE